MYRLKQLEQQKQVLTEALHEAEKPLARYKDDEDLDQILREMDRAEDPMLAFIKKKKKNTGPPVKGMSLSSSTSFSTHCVSFLACPTILRHHANVVILL